MIQYELVLYCILSAGAFLLVVSGLTDLIAAKAKLTRGLPPEMIEKTDVAGFVINFLMELLFLVVIPSIGYALFYLIMPLEGVRAGLAVALIAFTVGAVPIIMVLSVRIKLPISYLLYVLFSQVIKLAGSLSIIAYLYSL
jgi:hypothetical protein